MKRATAPVVDELTLRRAVQAAALGLEYPDADWPHRLELLRAGAIAMAAPAGSQLTAFLAGVAAADTAAVQRAYVDTFDLRLRCCPYLTYYSHGDTRRRGMALLQFSQTYRRAGFEIISGELPDHLAVLCEFTARVPAAGLALFARHRAGLELLHLALGDQGSPYVHLTALIRTVLPEPAPRDLQRALDLARSGPPAEEVGLEPFAPPESAEARR
jgi:nitrate reductase delta subunit